MMYCAVNAKIKAMRASGKRDSKALLHYIYDRPQKNFLKILATGLNSGRLDTAYYLQLWRGLNMLDKSSRDALRRVIGAEIDLQNILWMYRLKRFYGVVGDATFAYLIPVGGRLPGEVFVRMANCKDVTALAAEVLQSPYGGVFNNFTDTNRAEEKLFKAVKKLYQREICKNSNSIAAVCLFLYER